MANAATLSRQGLIQTSRHQISLVRYIQVPRARPRNPPLPWGPRFGTLEWMDRCVLVDPLHGWAEDVFEPIRPWERSSILRGLPRSIVRAALLDHFP
ncbi:MAG: hypothetical protein KC766_31090, partial [Myxococcales bacterium]|nr:hypothetical protein [Myxococcales bacterium]